MTEQQLLPYIPLIGFGTLIVVFGGAIWLTIALARRNTRIAKRKMREYRQQDLETYYSVDPQYRPYAEDAKAAGVSPAVYAQTDDYGVCADCQQITPRFRACTHCHGMRVLTFEDAAWTPAMQRTSYGLLGVSIVLLLTGVGIPFVYFPYAIYKGMKGKAEKRAAAYRNQVARKLTPHQQPATPRVPTSPSPSFAEHTWTCSCGEINIKSFNYCRRCERLREP